MKNFEKEQLCNRCGKCCYYKTKVGKISVFTSNHCEYLDEKTNLCTVYENRFKVKPDCLPIEKAIEISALPNDCPYVKDIEGYEGPLG
jgi:uncharacterized cysteine cluster protein YcgN (CxxCxxCC family)